MHVVLAGGGTAGHIEPALALADALRRQDPTVGITALGTERGLETRLVPERGYELALIPAVPLPRRPTPELITVPGRLRGTIKATEQVLERTKADCVMGFGGYVALPGYLAAKRLGVPIVIHQEGRTPCTCVVAVAGPFDFDDVSAQVCQGLRTPRTSQNTREIENANTVE